MSKPNITGCGKVLVARLQMNHPGEIPFSTAQLTDMAAKPQSELRVHSTIQKLTAVIIGKHCCLRQFTEGAFMFL